MRARSISPTRVVTAGAALALIPTMLSVAASPAPAQTEPVYDVILRGGTVFDGTGRPGELADVALADGYVAAVGDLDGATADTEIDVAGQYVAPGFIDVHSHSDPDALPTATNVLTQGVTTEMLNPDGGGPLDIGAQLEALRDGGLAANVGAYMGFNSVWREVVGLDDVPATGEQIVQMRRLIRQGLRDGAFSVSSGLDYVPARYASTDQVVDVVRVAGNWRTSFPNHDRLVAEHDYSSIVGMAETIEIGERSGVAPEITHMKVQGHEQGRADEILAMMADASARGVYTPADVYPYLAGQTGLANLIIPSWAQAGGRDAMLERFADPELRQQIIVEAEEAMDLRFNGPEGVHVIGVGELVDEMADRGVGAGEAVIQLLEEAEYGAILTFGSEEDLVEIMQYDDAAIGSDGGATLSQSHPRLYGTFPRVLGRYVRERGVLTWENAIRKMTGLPATIVGLADRGFLVPGMAADVTVFDPETVIDHATFENPKAYSEGIEQVFVNGVQVVRDGEVTGEQGGQALTRTRHEPTRPMGFDVDRRVAATGLLSAAEGGPRRIVPVSFDVRQVADSAEVKGSFHLVDPRAGVLISSTDLGLLQTTDDWASLTGRAVVLPSRQERSVTVTVERSDPFVTGHPPTVTVEVEDLYQVSGTLLPERIILLPR